MTNSVPPAQPGDDSRAAHRLSELIRYHRDEIVTEWVRRVSALRQAREVDRPTLIDCIPDLLDRIAAAAANNSPAYPREAAEKHATERLHEGFDMASVVAELRLLRQSVLHVWRTKIGDTIRLAELEPLDQGIDASVAAAVDRYSEFYHQMCKAADRATPDLRERERQRRAIVEAHGGPLAANTGESGGASFDWMLPIKPTDQ